MTNTPRTSPRTPACADRRKRAESSAPASTSDGPPSSESSPGGELHQTADGAGSRLTTQQGIPISDDQNSLKVGDRGPTLLEDFVMREKIFHFDHERIPERVVHARGYGAHGYLRDLRVARRPHLGRPLPARPASRRPAFVRFSTVAGNKGSSDLARDVRGLRREVLHAGRELGSRRQQHPGVLHPGRHQVPRPGARGRSRSPTAASRRPSRPTTTSGTSSR